MEPISEERQRKVYEWWIGTPVNIDKATLLDDFTDAIAALPHCDTVALPKFYTKDHDHNWQPNYQFFFTEVVPRLNDARVVVRFGFADDKWFYVDPLDTDDVYANPDPIAATAEYVESLERR